MSFPATNTILTYSSPLLEVEYFFVKNFKSETKTKRFLCEILTESCNNPIGNASSALLVESIKTSNSTNGRHLYS